MYDAYIIVHYQLLNHTIVPSISATLNCLHRYIKEEPMKIVNNSKMKVGETETTIQISDRKDINRTYTQCHPLNLPFHQGQHMQEHTIHQWHKEAGGASCISE